MGAGCDDESGGLRAGDVRRGADGFAACDLISSLQHATPFSEQDDLDLGVN